MGLRTVLLERAWMSVSEICCDALPSAPGGGQHEGYVAYYVRRGGFAYRGTGGTFEAVTGSVVVGAPGETYSARHSDVYGDECVAVRIVPDALAELAGARGWRTQLVPPLPELVVLGELLSAAAAGKGNVPLAEAAAAFAARVARIVSENTPLRTAPQRAASRRVAETALWMNENAGDDIDLDRAAAQAGMSPFHFLRTFSQTLGVTPHQYVVRSRVRRAARLLVDDRDRSITQIALDAGFADLSNFIRTFRRAAGAPPHRFRRAAGDGKKLQDRLPAI